MIYWSLTSKLSEKTIIKLCFKMSDRSEMVFTNLLERATELVLNMSLCMCMYLYTHMCKVYKCTHLVCIVLVQIV